MFFNYREGAYPESLGDFGGAPDSRNLRAAPAGVELEAMEWAFHTITAQFAGAERRAAVWAQVNGASCPAPHVPPEHHFLAHAGYPDRAPAGDLF